MTPLAIAPLIRIESYHCYRLTLDLKIPPVTGALIMEGDHFRRAYPLPSAGEPRGFGMKPGNDRSLVLWTTNPVGAQVRLTLIGVNEPGVVGGYELREIDPRSLPVEVDGLLPLSGLVRAGEAAWLETPRRFIPGYAATVDERPARVAESPDHSVMVEVPAGEHQFNLRYAGTPRLLAAFWASFSTGCLLAVSALGWLASRAIRQFRSGPMGGNAGSGPIPAPPLAQA